MQGGGWWTEGVGRKGVVQDAGNKLLGARSRGGCEENRGFGAGSPGIAIALLGDLSRWEG